MFLFKSITRRIIFLHVIAISITSAFMPVALYLLLRSAADDLQHRALRENAGLIASHLSQEPDGGIGLHLPPELATLFGVLWPLRVLGRGCLRARALFLAPWRQGGL